jgi:hypothetical protein
VKKLIPVLVSVLLAAVAPACSEQTNAPSPVSGGDAPGAGGSSATAVFVGAGDIGLCGSAGPEATALLLDRQPGTVFTLGDNAYPRGSEEDYRNCYAPSWGRHRTRTRPVPGNHEYETPGAAGYFAYFGMRAAPDEGGYYAYTLGAWRIIALNSEIPVSGSSPQAAWLEAELATTRFACTAAYWHRPLVSSGPHGDNPDMTDLFRLLYDAGVEFVLSGHDHIYERFQRLDPSGRPDARGTRQFIVGTGGTALYMPQRVRTGSEVQAAEWGVLRLDLAPGSYRWQFLPVAGGSFQDSGFDTCR